jgi:acyl carrier protein
MMHSEIMKSLETMLRSFQGREYTGAFHEQTRFLGDLSFSSIDVVILGEALESHFGRELPFGDLIRSVAEQGEQDMTVGMLAQFLETHLQR